MLPMLQRNFQDNYFVQLLFVHMKATEQLAVGELTVGMEEEMAVDRVWEMEVALAE